MLSSRTADQNARREARAARIAAWAERTARIASRVAEIEARAPRSVAEIVSRLPSLAAEVVRQDIASGQVHGVRSNEHDEVVALCFALRSLLQSGASVHENAGSDSETTFGTLVAQREAAENTVVRALIAVGYDASFLRAWLRSTDRGEPLGVDPTREMVWHPVVSSSADLEEALAIRYGKQA